MTRVRSLDAADWHRSMENVQEVEHEYDYDYSVCNG